MEKLITSTSKVTNAAHINLSGKLACSIPEMADVLGVSKPTAYALASSAGFPILKIGKRKVVPIKALEEWIEKNSKND